MAADEQDPRPGDTDNSLLRKILLRLRSLISAVGAGGSPIIGPITISPEDIEIGAVEIKDSSTDSRATVLSSCPAVNDFGLVVRNIPCGTYLVDGSGSVQPVSGSVAVSNFPAVQTVAVNNFPATQPVSGTVAVSNFPAIQPVSGTVTSNQGTPNTLANAWPVELSDGTFLLGTAAHPVRTDPTGATTQPVSGTVSVGNFPAVQTVSVNNFPATQAVSSTQLPAALVGGRLDTNLGSWLGSTAPTVGQKTMANSLPVVIASDQSTLSTDVIDRAARLLGHVTVDNFPATQPVSGTVTANQGTPNSLANAWPVELSDGTFLLGTPTHPVRTDPTGTTIQPVSGTVAVSNFPATQPVSGTVAVSNFPALQVVTGNKTNNAAILDATNFGVLPARANAAAPAWTENFLVALSVDLIGNLRTINPVQLPAGLIGGRLDTNIGSWLGSTAPTVGQKTMANSIPVTLASDQTSLAVTVGNFPATQPVSGTVAVSNFPATQVIAGAKSNNAVVPGATNLGVLPAVANAAPPTWTETFQVVLSEDLSGNLRTINPVQLPAALVGGRLDTNLGAWLGSTAPTVGQKTMANSIPVTFASDQTALTVTSTLTGLKSNNAVVPGATNLGVLPAVANAAPPTWTESFQVVLSEDLAGNLRTINPVQLPSALIANRLDTNIGSWFGSTAPTVGQKTMAASIPVTLASDQTALAVTGPLTDTQLRASAVPITGNKTNNNAAPGATNIGVLPAIANAAAPTWVEGDQVLLSEDLSGGLRVTGTKSNNTAAPGANAQSVLSAVATAAPPAYTEGFLVDQSVDLSGNLRTVSAQNQGKTVNRFVLAQGSTPGTTVIAAANATSKHKIVGAFFTLNASGTAKFTATADLTGAMDVIVQGGFVLPTSLPNTWIETPVNQALSIVTVGGGANGVILYITEP